MLCLARMIQALSLRGAASGRIQIGSLSLVPGDACRRGTAFGYEPVRLKLWQQKKLRTVTGAVICRKHLALIHDRDMLRHKGQRREASIRPSEFGFLQFGRCGKIPVLSEPRAGLY